MDRPPEKTEKQFPDAKIANVQELLLYEMRSGSFARQDRLPRESMLAEELGISRTQLRDSLAELEREGFISRRQGVGTIINRHVLNVPVRMDLEIEFMEMVKRSGGVPAERLVKVGSVLSAPAAEKLGLNRTDEMLFVSRIVTDREKPVIYCEDFIPMKLIKRMDFTRAALEKPIFSFLSEYCGKEAYLDVTELKPFSACGSAARYLNVKDGTVLLFMDEVDYDFEGEPVMYSRQYYIDGVISHKVVRRKI